MFKQVITEKERLLSDRKELSDKIRLSRRHLAIIEDRQVLRILLK